MTPTTYELSTALRSLVTEIEDAECIDRLDPSQAQRLLAAIRRARTALYLYDQSQLPAHAY